MSARSCTAEASVIADRAEHNGALSAAQSTCCDAPVPRTDWSDLGASDHCILVYEEDAHLLDAVSRFTGTGLAVGEAAVVIATQPHLDHLEARLRAHGVDFATPRCERLVRQFLTLARQHSPERSVVALNPLVTETVDLLAPSLQVDNIAVHLHPADDLPLLWADPHQLQQVVVNLLTNAQQALRDVSAPRQLTITTQGDAAHTRVTLAVADTGPGIPLALQARLFEPFFTTKPQGVGTGLGLSLCRGIIEEHGGTLRVTSYPGLGATFHVELPVGAVPATTPVRPGVADGPAVRSCAILLVEDEPGIANGLARLLRRDGHTVDMAANGRLALAKLQERAYDLLLSDVRMPELDGPGLYRILAQQQPYLCQRLVFLTGDTLAPETKSFLEQSGARCLEKPFTIAIVRGVLQQFLQAV